MAKRNKNCLPAMDYQVLRDAYYGTGGYSDGSYLIQHKRERADKYNMRRQLSYYLNYVAPCVNSHVDPIFREEIPRDWTGAGSKLFEAFVNNVDLNGTSIQNMAKRAALGAKLYGVNFVVMDNVAEQPDTVDKALQQRALPYCYIVEPARVISAKTDRYGRLTLFSYREAKEDTGDDNRLIDGKPDYNVRTWTTTGWTLTDGDGKNTLGSGDHNLGRVPVAIFRSREMDPAIVLQPSEFASIAKTNNHIFQLCSWLSEILQNQAFSILMYPRDAGEETNLIIGTDNALSFPSDATHTPGFIAPSADPATMITNQIDRLIQEIYRMANLSLVTGSVKQQSGIAKAWDFERTNQTLSNFSANCQAAEEDIATLFALWTGQQLDYTVQYPTDFALVDVADELDNAEKAVSLNFGSTFLAEVARKVLQAYLPGIEPETYDKIITDIEANGVDQLQSKVGDYGYTQDVVNMSALTDVLRQILASADVDPDLKAQAEAALAKVA